MKLYYFQKKEGNFGDDLNSWLWQRLMPNTFDNDSKEVFFGIGTIINDRICDRAPSANKIVIFSSGVGYGKAPLKNLPLIDGKFKVYCVRGPLSADMLGLSSDLAIADGAILIRRLFEPDTKKIYRYSYMPHVSQAINNGLGWYSLCRQIDFGYIDPRWSREKVLNALSQTEVLLTEAMHGAIVADALRIPWIPIKTSEKIFEFKWWDWCRSVGLHYQPQRVDYLPQKKGVMSRIKEEFAAKHIKTQLKTIAQLSTPFLSKDSKIEQLTRRLEEKIQTFKDDIYCNSL